jgi:hypothetical protein
VTVGCGGVEVEGETAAGLGSSSRRGSGGEVAIYTVEPCRALIGLD